MAPTKKNQCVSFLKGLSLIAVIWIHLMEWTDHQLTESELLARELLYPGVLFFIALTGTVVYLAYHKKDLWTATKRLWARGMSLIAIYFVYNIVKYYFYDFAKEPFYWQFPEKNIWSLGHILTLQSFAVPLSIILSIGVFLILSPALLWIHHRCKRPTPWLLGILSLSILVAYIIPWPTQNSVIDFLFARNNIMFPVILWWIPFLLGYILAYFGLEQRRRLWLLIFGILSLSALALILFKQENWLITPYMYPLKPYYIIVSLFLMAALMELHHWLQQIPWRWFRAGLFGIGFLGDNTLSLYIFHWIMVDLLYYLYFPDVKILWTLIPLTMALFAIVLYLRNARKSDLSRDKVLSSKKGP